MNFQSGNFFLAHPVFWQIQIAISLDWKKINAFCLFYSIMHSLGLQDIIMDKVVSKIIFCEMSSCVPTVLLTELLRYGMIYRITLSHQLILGDGR